MLDVIPEALLHRIMLYFTAKDFANILSVSTSLKSVADQEMDFIINKIWGNYYPTLSKEQFWYKSRPYSTILHELTRRTVIVVRGFITYQLDIATDQWKRCHDSRRDRGYFAMVYLRGEVYAIGTYSLVAAGTVEKYNPFTDHWDMVENLPERSKSVAAATHNDEIYVCGGIDSVDEQIYDTIYKMALRDPMQDLQDINGNKCIECWNLCPFRLLRTRYRHAAVSYGGKMWIAGGCLADGSVTNSVEIIDTNNTTVIEGPPMLVRRDFANLLVVNGTLYAVGGDVNYEGCSIVRTIEYLDKIDNIWKHSTVFKDERMGFSTCADGNKIYIFGGSRSSTLGGEDTWDAYNVVDDVWDSDIIPCSTDSNTEQRHTMPPIACWGQAVTFPEDKITW